MLRKRTALAITLAIANVAAAVACSSFSTSPPEVDAAAEPEGFPAEAGAVIDAQEPVADAAEPINLLVNPGFENGCSPWKPGGGNAGAVTEARLGRTGAGACLVCGSAAGKGPFDIAQTLTGVVPVPGATFVGEAFVRAPESGPIATDLQAAFIVYDAKNVQHREAGAPSALDVTWTRVPLAITITGDGGATLEFSVASFGNGTGCFLVDDARVYQE